MVLCSRRANVKPIEDSVVVSALISAILKASKEERALSGRLRGGALDVAIGAVWRAALLTKLKAEFFLAKFATAPDARSNPAAQTAHCVPSPVAPTAWEACRDASHYAIA